MGKFSKSSSSTPQVIGGNISINGQSKANTNYQNGQLVTNYNMSPLEEQTLNYTQSQILNNLDNINVFSPKTMDNIYKELNAYKLQGINDINETYTPMLQELQENIASRFGNLDNSVFMDNLNSIESKRADAISELATNLQSKQSSLINNELSNRYNYLNYLSNLQNSINNNMLNTINASRNSTQVYNNTTSSNNGFNDYANLIIKAAGSFVPGLSTVNSFL